MSAVLKVASLLLVFLSSAVPTSAGECRDLVDAGSIPPRSDEDCALWDAGAKQRAEEREAQNVRDAQDTVVINDYFDRNPSVERTYPCNLIEGKAANVTDCRRNVEAMSRVDSYFAKRPKAKRPDDCSLPLRSGFLYACEAQIEAASNPEPKPQWHRLIKDTVACYRNGIYSGGEYVGASEGCIEVRAGQVFLLRAAASVGDDGKTKWLKPLSSEYVAASNGVSSLTFRSAAFGKKVLNCRAKTVLLHQEITCAQ